MKRLVTGDEATTTKQQHKSPCADCPWARKSLPGWLGNGSVDEWLWAAHSESMIECHTRMPHQCAGAAIYRANVCKLPRDPSRLRLPADKKTVFASRDEFRKHHEDL